MDLVGKTKEYERASIELVYLEEKDVIATSGTIGEGSWDKSGWT